jgi:hypothetical protein
MFVKGWNKFKFIITPDELEQVLDGFRHVVFQHAERQKEDELALLLGETGLLAEGNSY